MTKKQIIFRADGNSETGLGHLFRLFALVEIFKLRYNYVFLTRESSVIDVVPKDYNLKVIPGTVGIDEEPDWISSYYSSTNHILIVDGYQFDGDYQKAIKHKGYFLVYIDDLVKKDLWADIIINHSLNVSKEDYGANEKTTYALGPKYAILRPSFIDEAQKQRRINHIDNIFVSFGGADFYDLTNTCVKGILDIEKIKKIHVVIGQAYNHSSLYETIKGYQDKVVLYQNLSEDEMISLMKQCQLAIIPSSTISYEVCSVKMIILSGYYVNNQINIYKGLKANGLIYDGADFNSYTSETFSKKVSEILNDDPIQYQEKIDKQTSFFDGKQKERILSLI